MRIGELARSIGVPVPTLRRWTQEFAEVLSEEARAADGRPRNFNGRDARVLRRAREILAEPGETYAGARAKLIAEGLANEGTTGSGGGSAAQAAESAKPPPSPEEERRHAERFVREI